MLGFTACSDDDPKDIIEKENSALIAKPSTINPKSEHPYYILNEDWFGHDNGSINKISEKGKITYRTYREANSGEKLGITSQYGACFGENFYIMSKQDNRLVVANKNTLKKVAVFQEIGGDGRAFVGINKDKAYFSTSEGVRVLNLATNTLGNTVAGDKGVSIPEIGNMVFAGKYVFGAGQKKIYVIDTEKDILVKVLDINNPGSVVKAFDGSVWAGNDQSLFRINHNTLEFEVVQNISDTGVKGTWFAWNKGSFTASSTENTLYWIGGGGMFGSGNTISSYNIDTKAYKPNFFTLGSEADYKIQSDYGTNTTSHKLSFYGGAININPLDGNIYATIKRDGWGDSGEYNWVFIINQKGQVDKTIAVKDNPDSEGKDKGYYWFPAMPLFNDYYKPEVLLKTVFLYTKKDLVIDLENIAFDHDNPRSSIDLAFEFPEGEGIFSHKIENNKLVITAKEEGVARFYIQATSNGVSSEKKEVSVRVSLNH